MTARWPTAAVVDGLQRLGWAEAKTPRQVYETVRRFQLGWNLGQPLVDDGDPGPVTSAALDLSLHRQEDGQPTASEHFSFSEFRCRCGGKYPDCERILVRRSLIVGLEVYRDRFSPAGLEIVGPYRCRQHNRSPAVKGATNSRHVTGEAIDVKMIVPTKAVADLHVFTGIGYQASTGLVRHVDTRGLNHIENPTPRATLAKPQTWRYC